MATFERYLVSLTNILDYAEDGKRCLIEGEAVLNAKHIISCGTNSRSDKSVGVLALCLQTSNLNEKPHQITAEFTETIDNAYSFKITCSCKAGLSGKCKHCIAVLLYLNRRALHELEDLSCTDSAQTWGKMKSGVKTLYDPVPLAKLCHVNESDNYSSLENPLDLEKANKIRNLLIGAAPTSALASHAKGRSTDVNILPSITNIECKEMVISGITDLVCEDNISVLLNNAESNPLFKTSKILDCNLFEQSNVNEMQFYNDNVCVSLEDSILICKFTIDQSNCKRWKVERKKRITGSTCYSLFTYKVRAGANKTDYWNAKIEKHFKSVNFKGNKDTSYGLENEPHALQRYEEVTGYAITLSGLIINPNIPWLAFSPDGIVFEEDRPSILIEVKCPTLGKTASIFEISRSKKLNYLKYMDGEYRLNEKHQYYGQVQMGMALLNINQAHLVCYSKFDHNILIVRVPKDEYFLNTMFEKLRMVYFKYMLPALYSDHRTSISD